MSTKKRHLSLKAFLAIVFYLIIPVCSVLLIHRAYPGISTEWLFNRIYWTLPTAFVIVILAQLSARTQKGETKRLFLNIGFTLTTLLWMYGLLGGRVVITTAWNGYDFSLHMEKYVILIGCVAAFNMIYYMLEWRVYRREKTVLSSRKRKTKSVTIE
jgi:hypothetical protein